MSRTCAGLGFAVSCLVLSLPSGCRRDGGEVISVDGSSTVFPITEAVAEEFQKSNDVHVTVGVSGTGGGFKKLCAGDIDIAGASRPIRPSEVDQCRAAGIGYIELPIAYDGIALVAHPANDWAEHFTVRELKVLFEPAAQAKLTRWSQVRTGWPDEEIHLFGPGVDSGTYDYFTQAVVGEEHSSRGDFSSSEDDNVLVQGVASDRLALGFFGFAYFNENRERLRAVPIDDEVAENGPGPIAPSFQTISNGTYQPLSRPVFLYVTARAADRPAVRAFVEYYLTGGRPLIREVGYVAMPDRVYELAQQRFERRTTGSVFSGGSRVGVTVEALLAAER